MRGEGDFFVIGVPVLLAGLILGLFIGIGARVANELSVVGALAAIEQLRSDVSKVGVGANEDVIGQVTAWNQKVTARKQYRQVWWGRLFVPKKWEEIQVIELATREGEDHALHQRR